MTLTAKDVAKILGISARTVYQLPIACYRIGRAVRYELADVEEYKQSCRCSNQKAVGASHLTVSLTDSVSALQSYFRKAGQPSKQTTSTKKNQQKSTHNLRLV